MNLTDRILGSAREDPDKPVIADRQGEWTYRRLFHEANTISGHLVKSGVESGDRVGIQVPPGRQFAASFLGIQRAGGVPVPLNWMLSPEKVRYIEKDSGLVRSVSISQLEDRNDALNKPVDLFSAIHDPDGEKHAKDGSPLETFVNERAELTSEVAVLLYTSGTTAMPKGVMLTHQNLLANIEASERAISIGREDYFLTSLPLFHSFALTCGLLLPLSTGAQTKLIAGFSPRELLSDLVEEIITKFIAIPSQYRSIARQAKNISEKELDLDVVRSRTIRFLSGGEPLPAVTRENVKEVLGSEILEGYGLTETAPVISVNRPEDNQPGSVGKPLYNVDVRIADQNQAESPVNTGEEGEIQVKGPSVMKGYLNMDDNIEDVFTPEGWFRTGDMGRLDEDGYLWVTGRLKEIIITAGENVAPAEIEEEIMKIDGVLTAAVIGKQDEKHGEVPVAFVVPEEGANPSPDDIRGRLRNHLANHKVPRDVNVSQDLPVGPTGKIAKRKLQDKT